MSERDRHVIPADQEHSTDPQCWCQPITTYEEPISGGRVWVHSRQSRQSAHRAPAGSPGSY